MRYAPTGEVSGEVTMPVSKPSSVMFGGKDLNELYITSIADGLTPKEKQKEPLAGDLFMVKTDVKGLPEPDYAG